MARREDSGELVAPEEVSIMTLTTTIIDMPIQLGPDLTEQEWQQVVQGHREAAIERLQTISVTDERYADIERAARGLFWHTDVMGRIQ